MHTNAQRARVQYKLLDAFALIEIIHMWWINVTVIDSWGNSTDSSGLATLRNTNISHLTHETE